MVEGSTRGRATSWIAVVVIIAGFILGGVGIIVASAWLAWLGVIVIVVGGIFGLATGIMKDVH
ncbi:MAG: hypothetical protein M3Q27_15655 [Actinomycetota bacterium]|nr:hypothetical protein [Actinomycetota bacterium]